VKALMAGSPAHRLRTETVKRSKAMAILVRRIEAFNEHDGEKSGKKKKSHQLKALSRIADAQRALAKCG
jgi:hypothetical protein